MNPEIHFTKEGVTLISWRSSPICVYHFGGMKFIGNDVVDYEIVDQKELNVSYAYLEISEDMETGILFDKEPMYKFHLKGYESDGFKIELKVKIHEGVDFELPKTRLLVLRVKKGIRRFAGFFFI